MPWMSAIVLTSAGSATLIVKVVFAVAGVVAESVTVAVTLPDGQRFEGPLVRYDDFIVILTMPDGTQRSFARNGDLPKVEVKDPREGHRKLLPTYTDKDMHDVTAYLATLK